MRPATLERFLRLLAADCGPQVFNPWAERDAQNDGRLNGPAARRERLRAHLAVAAQQVLIGEASGYQGCHVTGIPFTSERLVIAGLVPRVASAGKRLSTRHIPWSEPSATVVWNTLHALRIERSTILWNAFPWHPHKPQQLQSNRTPTSSERARGLPALAELLAGCAHAAIFAVGRHAELALHEIGYRAIALRHPSMGGARLFCQALKAHARALAPRLRQCDR